MQEKPAQASAPLALLTLPALYCRPKLGFVWDLVIATSAFYSEINVTVRTAKFMVS